MIFLGILVAIALVAGVVAYFVGGSSRSRSATALKPPPERTEGPSATLPPKSDTAKPAGAKPGEAESGQAEIPYAPPISEDEARDAVEQARVEDDLAESETLDRQPTMRERIARARSSFGGYLKSIRSRNTIDADTWDELEEALIRADVGVHHTSELLEAVRERVKANSITGTDASAPTSRRCGCSSV
jgi:fused signal recognition particle receptor